MLREINITRSSEMSSQRPAGNGGGGESPIRRTIKLLSYALLLLGMIAINAGLYFDQSRWFAVASWCRTLGFNGFSLGLLFIIFSLYWPAKRG